jgi:hypothetical protein
MGTHPTCLCELIPVPVMIFGACDAYQEGMGGVAFPLDLQSAPILSWTPFPSVTQAAMITTQNLEGTLTNLALELAGTIAHNEIVAGP